MKKKKRPTRRKRCRTDATSSRPCSRKLLVGCVAALVVTGVVVAGMTSLAAQKAPAVEPAWIELPDHEDGGTYVQGCAIDDDGDFAYVIKRGVDKSTSLQRVDLRQGNSKKLDLTVAAKKAVGQGNDLAYVLADSGRYLLVAPSGRAHHLALLKLEANKVKYEGKIPVSDILVDDIQKVAVEGVTGDKVTAIIGEGSCLRRVKIDVKNRKKVTEGKAITGLSSVCDQSIGIDQAGATKYLYACHGGFTSSTGYVMKYEMTGHKLKKIWEKPTAGEPQSAVPRHGKLLVFLEGNTRWGASHDQEFTDRIVCWDS